MSGRRVLYLSTAHSTNHNYTYNGLNSASDPARAGKTVDYSSGLRQLRLIGAIVCLLAALKVSIWWVRFVTLNHVLRFAGDRKSVV